MVWAFRVSSAVACLTNLEIDARSTAAYGIAHIFAALTVSNHELRAKALAEKDISPEQFVSLLKDIMILMLLFLLYS